MSEKKAGILLVVAEEFRKHRLPRLEAIKKEVDKGNLMSDLDIEFLEKVLHDAQRTFPSL